MEEKYVAGTPFSVSRMFAVRAQPALGLLPGNQGFHIMQRKDLLAAPISPPHIMTFVFPPFQFSLFPDFSQV